MKNKVILCAPLNSSFTPGITRAFNYLEYDVTFFNSRGRPIFETNDNKLIKLVKKIEPNFVLILKGESIGGFTIKAIRSLGVKVVNWFPDYVNAFDLAYMLSEYYDFFFHFDPLAVSQLKKRGRKNIYYLPFSSDILPNDLISRSLDYKYDISFIGNYYPIREKYLKSVSDLGLNIWGDKRWAKSSLASCYKGCQLPNSKFAEVSRSSRININIQHEYPCAGLVLRPFEILGSGAFLLTQDEKDARRLFNDNIVTFRSPVELRKRVIYFLGHGSKRNSLINKGYKITKKHHTYIHRLKTIINIIK